MKKIIIIVSLFAFVGIANAQKLNVPAAVKATFATKFAEVKKVKWGKEGEKDFEAEFTYKGHEMSAVIDAKGNLLETETEIAVSALPKTIQEQLKGKKITEATEIIDAKGIKTYEAEVGGKDLIFDESGKMIKK